jgi:ubiquinone/menaquinone biosynthesis C-methylase UbiE
MNRNRTHGSGYDFRSDYETWKKYARRFHARNIENQDLYCLTQSLVEKTAHRQVAEAKTNRSRILEIGGGGGEHIAFEKNVSSENYVVVDVETQFLDILRKQFDVAILAADGCSLPLKTASFSTIISTSVFEHVDQLENMLLEIKRVLTQDGDLLVIVPTNGSLIIEAYKLFISYPFMRYNGIKKPDHIWNYVNVNSFKRINALLHIHFTSIRKQSIPFKMLPSFLSPLYFFHCRND